MTALRRSSLLALLLLSLACRSAAPQPTAFLPDGLAAVDRTIEAAIAQSRTPGGVLWIERHGDRHVRAYGHRAILPSLEEATVETIYDAASLTKPLATAPAIYLLQERGRLSIDDPVTRYLPSFGDERVTIRHLLTHTSGLRPGLDLSVPWSGYDQGIARAAAERPMLTPGAVFVYSDINFILLGEIVRRVSGQPLNTFVEREIHAKLGMRDTRFLPPSSMRDRIAPTEQTGTEMLRGVVHDPTSRRMGGVAGHAGLFTTAADVARYARMLLNGGSLDGVRLFAPSTVAMMTGVQTPPGVAVRRAGGWDIDSNYCRPRGAHFPLGSFGHTGWTGSFLWIDPYTGTFYALLSNRVHPDGKGGVVSLQYALGTAVAEALAGVDFENLPGTLPPRPGNIRPPPGGETMNGIDVLFHDRFAALQGLRIGLITNQTGIDRYGNPTSDLLRAAPGVELAALFSPEHGIQGALDSMVQDGRDPGSGLPVYSLYGERRKPAPEQLQGLDALVFDIQDIGARFYTYISTMGLAMEAAAESGVRFIVLDRVNPIGGVIVEGPLRQGEEMFTAWHPIVVRHGMTVGELARMFREERGMTLDLEVIELSHWSRDAWFDHTGQRWVNPSPNMRSLEAATLYPGLCLLEAAEVSVGRGTETPFHLFGAPYIDGELLARELSGAVAGLEVAPVRFTPQSSVFSGIECGGVKLTVTDREAFRPVRAGLFIAAALHRLYPQHFTIEKVDRLLRHPPTIDAIRSGREPGEIEAGWKRDLDEFSIRRERYLLYRP